MNNNKSEKDFYSEPFPLNSELFDAFISIEQYTLNARIKKADGEESN
jgi:hypothetical protein